ncbi:unnamed protein product, partial [Amoebophrya sp. A120]
DRFREAYEESQKTASILAWAVTGVACLLGVAAVTLALVVVFHFLLARGPCSCCCWRT